MLIEGNNIMSVKRMNRSAVLKILGQEGASSRKHLAEITRLTPAAITKISSELIAEKLINEGDTMSFGNVGRKEVALTLNPYARCALGIHINIGFAIVSGVWLDGSLIFEEKISIPEKSPAEETIKMLCERLLALSRRNIKDKSLIIGVGIAARGIHSTDFRTLINSYQALDGRNIPIAELVEKYTGFPAAVENNVRALLNAHMFLSRDKSLNSVFLLRCEYGIGGALALDGKIWQGSSGQCSEIGHISVVASGGKTCRCGKRGCLETVASPTAIIESALEIMSEEGTPVLYNRAQTVGRENIHIDDIFTSAACGDGEIRDIIGKAVTYLASAVKMALYTLDPEKVILYGRMFENDYFLAKFNAEMQDNIDAYHKVPIEKSKLNKKLESQAAALFTVNDFIEKGGLL